MDHLLDRPNVFAIFCGSKYSVITAVLIPVSTAVRTTAAGTYAATPLRIGVYTVAVEAAGFKTETRNNIVLQVQDRLRIDFELQVGERTDQVMVEAAPPALQTETSSLGDVITSNQVTSLPLSRRDYTQLAVLTAGVSRTDQGDNGNKGRFCSDPAGPQLPSWHGRLAHATQRMNMGWKPMPRWGAPRPMKKSLSDFELGRDT